MANTLKFKRGLVAGLPTAALGEPLFTTDTFDLYIGNGTGNTRFQKYIASGATTQILRGDGSLYTFPLAISSPSNGQVLKYNGTSWVNDSDSGITGSLTTNYLPKATGATTLGNSLLQEGTTSIGLGVTPSGWQTMNGINVGDVGSIGSKRFSAGNVQTIVGNNVFYDNSGFKYITSDPSSWIRFVNDEIRFLYAATGTANALQSPTQAMTLNNSGRLLLGTTTDSGQRLQVNGTALISGAATITGNLTVDTNTLFVDATDNEVGIGTTNPLYTFHTISANSTIGAFRNSGAALGQLLVGNTAGDTIIRILATGDSLISSDTGKYLAFGSNGGTERLRLDASGNLGLGVTPSAWGGGARGAIDLGTYGGVASTSTIGTALAWNTFHNGTNWIAKLTGASYGVLVFDNSFKWLQASSGTAGSTVSLTQAMTLDASGNLGVGLNTHTSKFEVFKSANDTLSRANAAVGIGDFVYGAGLLMQQRVSAPYGFMVQATNSAVNTFYPLLLQPSGGNVVLGATSDSGERLQVTGTAKITGASVFGGSMTINNDLRLVTSSTGGITIEASSGAETPNLTFLSTTNRYNLDNSSGTLRFFREDTNGTNGAVRMSLTDSGLLLLGSSTSTGEQLQVTGTAKITANNVQLTLQTASATGYASTTYVTASRSFVTGVGGASAGVTETRDAYYIYDNTASAVRLSINSSGNVSIANNLAVDTNTLFVDATNNRVGIGTASPSAALHIVGTESRFGGVSSGFISLYNASNRSGYIQANNTVDLRIASDNDPMTFYIAGSERARFTTGGNLLINTTTDSGYKLRVNGTGYFDDNLRFPNLKGVVFVQTGGSLLGSISMDSSNQVTIDNNGFFGLSVGTNYNLLGGNTGIGTNTFGTSATRTFAMLNGTAPSTSPTDTFQMYSNDVTAGNAAPHFRTENGAVIKLYQETTSVGNSIISLGGGNAVLDDTTFDGYTLRQIVKALRNQGILA